MGGTVDCDNNLLRTWLSRKFSFKNKSVKAIPNFVYISLLCLATLAFRFTQRDYATVEPPVDPNTLVLKYFIFTLMTARDFGRI